MLSLLHLEGGTYTLMEIELQGQMALRLAWKFAPPFSQRVALGPADIYSRPLTSRLIGVDQPVIRTRNGFSTLQPTQLICI